MCTATWFNVHVSWPSHDFISANSGRGGFSPLLSAALREFPCRAVGERGRVVAIVDSHCRISLAQLCAWHSCTVFLIVSGTGASSAVRVPTQPRPGCVSRPPSPVASTDRAASSSRDWEGHGTGKNEVRSVQRRARRGHGVPASPRAYSRPRARRVAPPASSPCGISRGRFPRKRGRSGDGTASVRGRKREGASAFVGRHLSRVSDVSAHPPSASRTFVSGTRENSVPSRRISLKDARLLSSRRRTLDYIFLSLCVT